jgi:hypothetical protein
MEVYGRVEMATHPSNQVRVTAMQEAINELEKTAAFLVTLFNYGQVDYRRDLTFDAVRDLRKALEGYRKIVKEEHL